MFLKDGKKLFISLCLVCAGIASAFSQEYTGNSQSEQCYISKIKDINIGYSCSTRKFKEDNGKKVVVTDSYSEQQLKRFGFTIKLNQKLEFIEDEQGNPISFSAKVNSKGENIDIKGKFLAADKLYLVSTINDKEKIEEIKISKKVLFPSAIEKLYASNLDEISYSSIDASTGFKIIDVKAKKISVESLPEDNLNGSYVKYKVNLDILPGISNYEWHDSSGKLMKEQTSILDISQVAVDKDKIFAPVGELDVLTFTLIPVNTDITTPFSIDQISYKIETNSVSPKDVFVSDDNQRIIQTKDNVVYLKNKHENVMDEKFNYPVDKKGKYEFLRSGPFIIPDDNAISLQAKTLVGQEKDAYKIAKKMEKWVFNNITNKNYSVNFANATEVMKKKQGDCTEHAVLLASMLRAAGIPSKIVTGLMFTNLPQNSFMYHMWVKAYVGKWVSLDPSFPSESFSPMHIAMYESPMNSLADKTEVVLNLVKSFSGFKVNILNYTPLNTGITNVSIGGKSSDSKIDILSLLKNPDNEYLKKISVKDNQGSSEIINIQVQNKTQDDYVRMALYDFSTGKINEAKENFNKASQMIAFYDDFSEMKLASKLAPIGLFSSIENNTKNIYDSEVWKDRLSVLRRIYYPLKALSSEQEAVLLQALSMVDFQKNPSAAISLLDKNKKTFNNCDYYHYIMSKAYALSENNKKALTEIQKTVDINPYNLMYKLELSRTYVKLKDFKQAKIELNKILEQKIQDYEFNKLVQSELNLVNVELEKKNKLKSQYSLAKYYYLSGESQQAIDVLEKMILSKTVDFNVYNLLGDIFLFQNQLDKAANSYNLTLKSWKNNPEALIGLGNAEYCRKNFDKALVYYQNALNVNDNSISAFIKTADCHRMLGQNQEAVNYYLKALKLDDKNAVANYSLALLQGEDVEKSESLLKKALSSNPDYIQAWIELASVQIKKKKYFLAKAYLAPVQYLDPKNPEYYFYTGLVNKYSENFSLAREDFKKAIAIKPDYNEAIHELDLLEINQ